MAVFLTSEASGAPPVLLHHLKHNKVLHERVMIMSVATTDIPLVPVAERIEQRVLGEGFYLVTGALRVHGNARRAAGTAAAVR